MLSAVFHTPNIEKWITVLYSRQTPVSCLRKYGGPIQPDLSLVQYKQARIKETIRPEFINKLLAQQRTKMCGTLSLTRYNLWSEIVLNFCRVKAQRL